MSPKYKIGEHVASWNSGLAYIVLAVHELDDCGSYAYSVRRSRAGNEWGPTRKIAEVGLVRQEVTP